jgi:hypothetical protein
MLYDVLMKINSSNIKFIQEFKYAKSFIISLLFHLQYSNDLLAIMQSVFMVSIDLCEICSLKKPTQWKGWNSKQNHNSEHEGCAMTIRLLHNFVSTHHTWWRPLWSSFAMDLHPPLLSSFLSRRVETNSKELQHFTTQCNLQRTFVVKILKVVLGDEYVV